MCKVNKVTQSNEPTVITQLCVHSSADGGGCHAMCQPAHQEQSGVQYLAKDTSTCRAGESNQRLPYSKTLALPLSHRHLNECRSCSVSAGCGNRVFFANIRIRIPLLSSKQGNYFATAAKGQ